IMACGCLFLAQERRTTRTCPLACQLLIENPSSSILREAAMKRAEDLRSANQGRCRSCGSVGLPGLPCGPFSLLPCLAHRGLLKTPHTIPRRLPRRNERTPAPRGTWCGLHGRCRRWSRSRTMQRCHPPPRASRCHVVARVQARTGGAAYHVVGKRVG